MADSYQFTPQVKVTRRPAARNPLSEIPELDLKGRRAEVHGSMDTPNAYDICFGNDFWIDGLEPMQALVILKKVRQMYMAEVNALQKEIDRISILDLPADDPRVHTEWPRYYELRAREGSGRR